MKPGSCACWKKGARSLIRRSDGLALRTASEQGAALLCRWWNDGAVMAHAGFPQRLGTTVEEVAAQLKADASSHRLLLLEDGCPVGEAVWRLAEEKGAAEIGIKPCVPSARGRGSGTQYLHRPLRYLFGPGGFALITLTTAEENRRARHVYEKLWFVQTAVFLFQTSQMPQACKALEYRLKKETYAALWGQVF